MRTRSIQRFAFLWVALLGALLGSCRIAKGPAVFTQESYVWQRQWTPVLDDALRHSASSVSGWRVLAAEANSTGAAVRVSIRPEELRRTGLPVVAVFRLDGHLARYAILSAVMLEIVQAWRSAGIAVKGVEIDHDCPVSQLAQYSRFLAALRPQLPAGLSLSITALPAWLGHRELRGLLGQVDEAVLQVHAVANPRQGLFAPAQAREWIERWARTSELPFRVALPNYGSRVSWNRAGWVTAIESEVERFGVDEESEELFARPEEVARLLEHLRLDHPANLKGIVWFRLPTVRDRRAWSLSTWHAVMAGRPLITQVRAELTPADVAGAQDVSVVNQGMIDAPLPAQVELAATGCEAADALPAYALERSARWLRFRLAQPRLLRSGERQVIGWIRCPGGADVRP